mgnify:CR=1 FL=1
MMDLTVTHKITQGMYVLTTEGGGCVVDAVSQVSGGDSPLFSVAVMKKNRTNELMRENSKFALSVLGVQGAGELIKQFGFQSSRDVNKFEGVAVTEVEGVKTLNDTLGYLVFEKVDAIENETHTLFIGRMIAGSVLNDEAPMSYGYYREHKEELLRVKTEKGQTAWVCTVCGYVYYGEELPEGYECPICSVDASLFVKKAN